MGAHCIYHLGLREHCWSTICLILRKTLRKEVRQEARETKELESTIYNERLLCCLTKLMKLLVCSGENWELSTASVFLADVSAVE